jgi:lipopolysaccharide assembly outer membrane protein LptD (OstA)
MGKGKIKAFHAWDEDYDRYVRHWNNKRRHNYSNWGSAVERERYRIILQHRSDFTERDALNVNAQYLSDSYYLSDFFRNDERREVMPINEVWYEHRENTWSAGASVSGPVNEFYGGVARLPEAWFSIEPQPVFDLPVNYESQTKAGYLNRQYAKYGSTDPMFRYDPYIGANGRGADYQAFRMDSAHRITAPFMVKDVLSVVPRAGYRGTWWSDAGDGESMWLTSADDAMYRGIAEIGATFSARAHAWLNENWQHIFEPYLDYSFQDVHFSSEGKNRHYVFDNYDASMDWLDQFGFEGRGLPYNWHGIRPGIRNYLRTRTKNGMAREILATDIYAAIPFLDESYRGSGDPLPGYPQKPEDGFYSRHDCVVPGFAMRFRPSNRFTFTSRTEYDIDRDKVAYADINMAYDVSHDFTWHMGYIGRDHRMWDYLPSNYDRWNYQYSNIISTGFRHDVCDWFAWAPFIRWDARCNELDEVGAWFDYLTDCLGFRLTLNYINSIRRVDGSKSESDFDIVFAVYLRALGAGSMLDYAKF